MQRIQKLCFVLLICSLIIPLTVATAFADSTTIVVDSNPDEGWAFNAEPPFVTPADYTTDEASIGIGSIHVEPITNSGGNQNKFILRYVSDSEILVSDFESFSIDFLIDDDDTSQVNQFYINFYTLTPDPSDGSWYDCRFDYVADSGSISSWSTLGFAAGDAADNVDSKLTTGSCPTSPAGMPAGSTVLFTSVNLGDTSANDTTVGGYFDNAQLTVSGSTTIFDFEPYKVAKTKDDCKKGGWQEVFRADGSSFKNQGDCIQYVNTGK